MAYAGLLQSLARMRKRMLVAVASLLSTGCTDISCDYRATHVSPLPMGSLLQTRKQLVGMLDQSIDEPSVYYLNITEPPGYSNRFVKKTIAVPVGSRFKVVGARKAHNPLCWAHDEELVLQAETPLESTNAEIHMKLPTALTHRAPGGTRAPQ